MVEAGCGGGAGGQRWQDFNGVITGASDKGTYVRVFDPPVEGRVMKGSKGWMSGIQVDVKLVHTDPQHAFIDFAHGAGQ